jgi:hypothetical protein
MLIDAGAGTSLGVVDATGDGAVEGAVELHPPMSAAPHSASVVKRWCIECELPANRFFIW